MTIKASVRAVLGAATILLTACGGGGGGDDSALIDINNPGSSSGGATGSKLVLACPVSIVAGKAAQGFTATLTNSSGTVVKNTFVSLIASVGDTVVGDIVATNPDGSTNPGGGNTNTLGKVPFTLTVPATTASTVKVTVKGSNAPDSTATFTGSCIVSVTPNPARLVITGPNGEPSGALGIEAAKSKAGFVVRLVDSTGDPIPDIDLVLQVTSDELTKAGTIDTIGTGKVTDTDGRVTFKYTAPATVADLATVHLTASTQVNGRTVSKVYDVYVYPTAVAAPDAPPTLQITAPSGQASGSVQIVSGESAANFFVQLLRGDGTAVVGQAVSLAIEQGSGTTAKVATPGSIRVNTPISASQPNVGRTNSEGKVLFSIVAPRTESASPQLYTVTASTTLNNQPQSGEFTVRVVPRGTPTLSLRAGNNQPSSSLTLASGERLNAFETQLLDGQGDALSGITLAVTATRGRVTTTAGTKTDIDGVLRFDYLAPTGVTEEDQVLIKVAGSADGYQIPAAEYLLNLAPSTLEVTGPQGAPSDSLSVVAGKSQAGFRLRLTDGAGRPLGGKTVSVRPRISGSSPSTAAGTVTLSRTATALDGTINFSYTAPRPATQSDTPILIGVSTTFRPSTESTTSETITSDYALTVVSRGLPKLVLRGPSDEPSGRIDVVADNIVAGLSATFTDGLGEPITAQELTLTPSIGTLRIADDSSTATDSNGQIRFDYFAPATVTARSRATITARGSADGSNITSTYLLNVLPIPADAAPRLTLTGPTEASPAQKRVGFTASFVRQDGQAIEGAPISFTTTGGTVGIIENGVERPGLSTGTTDSFGRISFTLTPASTAADTTARITAGLGSGASSSLSQQCQSSGSCTAALNVTVRADTFRFLSPVFGTNVTVGVPNAQPLSFRWQDSAGAGVPACIDLDASFTGSSNAPFGLIVSTDPTPRTQIRRVQLNASGEIQTGVSVYSDRSGFVNITARENRNCLEAGGTSTGLSATTGVQFVDEPGTANNHVDLDAPLKVQESSDTGSQRRATVTLNVRNNAFGVLDGEQVLFCISDRTISTTTTTSNTSTTPPTTTSTTSAPQSRAENQNERVFPGGGTTNSEGIATTQYFVPLLNLTNNSTVNGTTTTTTTQTAGVVISGCVRRASCTQSNDGQVCSTRNVQIVPATP